MIEDFLLRLLIQDEGLKVDPYKDHLGYWTVGIGHLIDRRKGGKLPSWIEFSFPLSEQEVLELGRQDINEKISELRTRLPQFAQLSETRQIVLVCMAFQMGVGGIFKFPKMLAAISRGDWVRASDEMLDSEWFGQTPGRAIRLSKVMLTNDVAAFQL